MYAISPLVAPTPENGLKRPTPQVLLDTKRWTPRVEVNTGVVAYVSVPPDRESEVAALGYPLVEGVS